MTFVIVLKNGQTIQATHTDTDDTDVAVFRAKKAGWQAVSAKALRND
jgi:hypothetical protein